MSRIITATPSTTPLLRADDILPGTAVTRDQVLELGDVISRRSGVRTSDSQTSVCDLTGVAVQDIQIAKAVLGEINSEESA